MSNGPLSNGTILNRRYQILERVGGGGMADVYRAGDMQTRSLVAIKGLRLDPQHTSEEQDMMRMAFKREVEILVKLTQSPQRSPHIPIFYESFEENDQSYLVMQFIEGQTLKEVMRQYAQGQCPQDLLIWYALQLCQALHHLHKQPHPIIFRDLKPDNVMINTSGNVYLIDFGIARHFTVGQEYDTFPFGTHGYAPPELYRDEQTEVRSDLFSLGATLHHCLTGQPPSGPGRNWFKFTSVRSYNPQISASLDKLIMQLVATKKAKRPANAEIVMRELEAIQQEIRTGHQPLDLGESVSFYDEVTAQAVSRLVSQPHEPVSFYDEITRRAASRFASQSQWNVLFTALKRAVSIVLFGLAAWLSTQGQQVGRWFHATRIPFLSSLSQSLGKVQRQNRPYSAPNSARTAPLASPSSIVQLFSISQSLLASPSRPNITHWPLHIMFMLGLLSSTAIWCISSLILFGTSLHIVICLLALLLFSIVLVTYLSPSISSEARILLSPVVLSATVVCFVMLSQNDISQIIEYHTIVQILSLSLLILTVSSLLCPVNSMRWLDHGAIIILALWEIMQWNMLGSSALQSLRIANDTSQIINWLVLSALLILLVIALCSHLFSKTASDYRISLFTFFLSLPVLFLQYFFGTPTLVSMKISWNPEILNTIFIILSLAVTLIALKWPNGQSSESRNGQSSVTRISWYDRLKRLPLLLLTLSVLCSQQFINMHMQLFVQSSIAGIYQWVTQSSVLVNIALGMLPILIIYGFIYDLKKNEQLLLLDHVVVIVIGLVCLTIDASHKTGVPSNTAYPLENSILLYIRLTIYAVLLFIAPYTILQLLEHAFWKPLFTVFTGLLGVSRRLLMLLCASFVLLILFTLGDGMDGWKHDGPWLYSGFIGGPPQQAPSWSQLLFPLLLLLLAAVTGVKLCFALLRSSGRHKLQTQRKHPFTAFHRLDYILILCTIIPLLLIWNVPEPQEAPVSLAALWLNIANGPLPLAAGLICLLVVATISLLWLRRPLDPRTHRVLRFLLLTSLVCLLCSFASALLFSHLNPIFAPLLLTGLLLLIGGMSLVSSTELTAKNTD